VTSILNVTSRMKLVLNGEEKEDKEVSGICGNVTHDLSLRVRGTLIENGTAPVDLAGSCVNDWLLYGDTVYASSKKRYGYCYSDIVHVVKDILRYEPVKGETNVNQFARSLGGVSRSTMGRIKNATGIKLETSDHPYTVLTNLVNNGFLILYQSNLSVTVGYGDSVQYVIFPILGTGSDEMHEQSMDVCPTPLLIKLKSKENTAGAPMIIGGLHRDSTQMNTPVIVLADAIAMADGVLIPVDSIRSSIGVRSVDLFATDDPNYREGVHHLSMTPDRSWPGDYLDDYYHKGDTIILTTSSSNNYSMRPGYNYTFNMEMVDPFGGASDTSGCPIGDVPFTISYVPDYLRWAPRDSLSNQWNNPANWVGISAQNKAIHEEARFAPLPTTKVVIPAMTDGMPYPVLPAAIGEKDSVKEVGFAYNVCDAIRFLPGAAIGQQQNMIYNDVIIDMSIPNQTWQLRAAPVTGLISGDLFMSNADLIYESDPWQVGEFDADGRNNTLGTGSFYLSVYNRETQNLGDGGSIKDTTYTAKSEWSKVTNGMTLSLPPASGWAVYSRTKSGKAAEIRLPKNDDEYYYYTKTGEKNGSETGLRAMRDGLAGAIGAGKLTYQPTAGAQDYAISKGVADSTFVFGNPTMGYIDIWGMIADNNALSKGIKAEFSYLDDAGHYTQIPKSVADLSANTLDNLLRYLPPMRAIILKATPGTALVVKLNANRIVTDTVSVPAATPAPIRRSDVRHNRGIMTVTAVNPVSSRCVSRLLIGQGYHDAIYDGEDAILTTVNIDKFHMTNTPTTPFNLYSVKDGYGLCVDLRDSVVNIPVSFCMSDLPYDPVTSLWFTGVNSIDGPLVLYDALLGTQRKIIDGICLDIETPETNNERRYYIRRPDYQPENPDTPIATGLDAWGTKEEQAYKFIRNGIVYILRNGHVYTTLGQQVR
ncbi:MAG: hypothetical protein IKT13_05290, partial [Paludibacteraceae bacterium]|nr:hypothetical protein [Paludibacteraceae bacterium]